MPSFEIDVTFFLRASAMLTVRRERDAAAGRATVRPDHVTVPLRERAAVVGGHEARVVRDRVGDRDAVASALPMFLSVIV